MRSSSSFTSLFLALAAIGSNAVHLQLSGQLASGPTPGLHRRTASMSGQVNDTQNMVYTVDVTLNDEKLTIMIDTGSSDLWVSSSVPNALPKNYIAGVTYASGSAQGQVMSATFGFAGYNIEEQYFISAPNGSAAAGSNGLVGLGPSSGSSIRSLGKSAAANPPLDRIFMGNTSLPPSIAILLQRSDDPQESYPGDLAIGEVLTDYEKILDQPKLPIAATSLQGGQHWQTYLDVHGLYGPDGKEIPLKTQVTGAKVPNATVVFDTGFTLPQVSPAVAEALYGGVPGASLQNIDQLQGKVWVLPCDQEVSATFVIGGVKFPIHPLDLNFDGFNLEENGNPICIGAFQPYSFDIVENGDITFDMILGMAFLRNAYMQINFGNLVNAATPSTSTAYIQLLPLTDAAKASQDFADVRKGGKGGTGSGTGSKLTSTSSSHGAKTLATWVVGVIVGVGALVALLVGLLCCCCCCRRRKNNNVAPAPATPWMTTQSYRPLNDPSPQAAYDMHMAPGAPRGYNPPHPPQYSTAWDARR